MQKEFFELVEAARNLKIKITDKPSPKCIAIQGNLSEFPENLKRLQEALEKFDSVSGTTLNDENKENDVNKYKKALDGIIKLLQIKGQDLDEIKSIITNSLEIEGETKSSNDYSTLPKFAPKAWKKKKGFRPRLKLTIDNKALDQINANDLLKMKTEIDMTNNMIGEMAIKQNSKEEKMIEELKQEYETLSNKK